jgi:hypothetical protein
MNLSIRAAMLAATLTLAVAAPAQPLRPAASFDKLYAAPGAAGYLGRAIVPTRDGGYLMIGEQSTTTIDAVAIKTDADGTVQWQQLYRLPGHSLDGQLIAQTASGFVAVLLMDMQTLVVMALDSAGQPVWQFAYPTGGDIGALPWSIEPTADGGILLDATDYDVPGFFGPLWGVKLDAQGAIQWQRAFGVLPGTLHALPDGGAVIAGYKPCTPQCVPWIARLDPDGLPTWAKQFRLGKGNAFAQSARPTPDGGIVVAGGYYDAPGSATSHVLLARLDLGGALQWAQGYAGSPCGAGAGAFDAMPMTGGLLVGLAAGCSSGSVVKTDANGTLLWQDQLADAHGQELLTERYTPTRDGGFVATGSLGSLRLAPRLLALKADHNGELPRCSGVRITSPGLSPLGAAALVATDAPITTEDTHVVPVATAIVATPSTLATSNGCRL